MAKKQTGVTTSSLDLDRDLEELDEDIEDVETKYEKAQRELVTQTVLMAI